MSNSWPLVPLGELLTKSEEWIDIKPEERYREITVRLWGKGVTLRREVSGTEIAASRRLRVKAGQFILSRIDARNGAFGLVPDALDGAIVSNDFPVFTPNSSKILPPFLNWMSKTRSFVDICKAASEGTTNRVRLQENRFLAMEVSLPPLPEQRRIVARIDELAAKIDEARGLRREVESESEALCRSMIFSGSPEYSKQTPVREFVRLRDPNIVTQPEETYRFAGVYCFGRGVFKGQTKTGAEFAYRRLTRLRAGDFVYPKLMAWEGALGVVPPECDGLFVSPEFPVFEVNQERALPDTLDIYFRTPSVWPLLSAISTGTNVRRRRLNPDDFLRFEMPLPPMHVQHKVREVKAKTEVAKQIRMETSAQLDAMLPSILDKAFKGEL